MNEMSEYYKALKEVEKPKKVPHKGNWNLVYLLGGKTFLLVGNIPYWLAVKNLKKVKNSPQYKNCEFKIIPYV